MSRSVPIIVLQGSAAALALSAALHGAINTTAALSKGEPIELLSLLAGTLPDELGLVVLLVAGALAIELAVVGWGRSSLRKLTVGSFVSSRADLVITALGLFGVHAAFAEIVSGGLSTVALKFLGDQAPLGHLRDAPLWLAVPALFLGATFCNYWTHRLMHTRLFWRLHAMHHAPTEFTVLTGAYASVVEAFAITTSVAVAYAAIGGSKEALYWATLLGGVEPLWSHCHIRGVEWVERFGINSPKAHTIHHAIDPRYFNRNFGDGVLVWDKLFGTYTPSAEIEGDLALGVRDPENLYYSGRALRDWCAPQLRWFVDGARWMSRRHRELRAVAVRRPIVLPIQEPRS